MNIKNELQNIFKGEVDDSDRTRDFYSHDASLFELKPEVVAFPKDADDIKATVNFVNQHKADNPELSITARSRGTDMSGAAINTSIVLDVSKYMTDIREITSTSAHVQPGRLYREFDVETKKQNAFLPSYPASWSLASVGGMANNNSGGEMSLTYGKTDQYVTELSIVLSDGNEYVVRPLDKAGLDAKMAQDDFEGNLYKKTYDLLEAHYDEIQAAKPNVSKDSTGYHLWNVWNRETGIFDLTKLFVGAQGTLGIVTDIKFKLVPEIKYSGTLVVYMRSIDNLGEIIPKTLSYQPIAFEGFDDKTLWLSFKFIFAFLPRLGLLSWVKMLFQLIPDALAFIKGFPKMVLLIEFGGTTQEEVTRRIHDARLGLQQFKDITYLEEDDTYEKADKFWKFRQESFNLLRKKVKDKHTAPYIDDFIVPPEHLPKFLPQIQAIIKKYNLLGTIAGHFGDGNFHVIPLMNIEKESERAKIEPSMKEVYDLVLQYGGSISGEHNDGLIRGPWLDKMYKPEALEAMRDIKKLYDPLSIFNPNKKVQATWDYSFSHVRQNF
jgi:FAD/FMN-containing dehydrogenase